VSKLLDTTPRLWAYYQHPPTFNDSSGPFRAAPFAVAGKDQHPQVTNVIRITRYAMMEGNACRFNEVEAWWFVDDDRWKWFSLCAASVHMHARPVTKAEYKTHFPNVPPLPKTAFQSDPNLSRANGWVFDPAPAGLRWRVFCYSSHFAALSNSSLGKEVTSR